MLDRLSLWAERNVRGLFAAALAVVFAAHLATVRYYPAPWLDEVQLIENGRCMAFDRATTWSVIERAEPGGAHVSGLLPTYLGGAAAEAVDRACGVWWAHRVFSLLGLLAATGFCLLWLRRKGFALPVACGVALLFCTDVHLTKSAHFYRPDAWALAMAFATALAVDAMGRRPGRPSPAALVVLGFALAAQVLFWFSAVFGLLLVAAELVLLAKRQAWPWRDALARTACVAAGGAAALLALLIVPFWRELPAFALFFLRHPDMRALQEAGAAQAGVGGVVVGHVRDLAILLARAPFLWALALAGVAVAFRRQRVFGGLLVGGLLFLLATRAYCFRIVYFLPLAAFFAAAAWSAAARRAAGRRGARAALALFAAVALAYGVVVNAVGLNAIAASGPRDGARAALTDELARTVGSGPKAVCVFSWQPYFIGRELGWRLFAFLPDNGKFIFDPRQAETLASLDVVLEQEVGAGVVEDNGRGPLSDEERSALRAAGFVPVGRVGAAAAARAQAQAGSLGARLRGFVWASEYPSYTVWKNTRKAESR